MRTRTILWHAPLLMLAPAPGFAATPPAADARPAAVVAELSACRTKADPVQRLACFDAAAARIDAATASRAIVIVDAQEIKQTRRSLFGFALPRIGLFGAHGPKDDSAASAREDIDELETTITRVQDLGNDKYQIVLAEGGTWRSTEPWSGAKLPKSGAKITIKRGALGNYFLRIEGGRAVRGMRVG